MTSSDMMSGTWKNTDRQDADAQRQDGLIRYDALYRKGVALLHEAGEQEGCAFEDAGLDVRLLLEEVCGTTLQTMLVHPETMVESDRQEQFLELVRRRSRHEPLAQILGYWYFCGLKLRVTEDVLIPEQDSEILVETALETLSVSREPLHILDLCTGSGCLAIALLSLLDQKGVSIGSCTCTDISPEALAVARENASALPGGKEAARRLRFLQGDLFAPVAGSQFNVLISNPPYIASEEIERLAPEVQLREPRLALDGGSDGLHFYRRIAGECGHCLNDGAHVFLEIGWDQREAVSQILASAGFTDIRSVRDYGGNDRVICGIFDMQGWRAAYPPALSCTSIA